MVTAVVDVTGGQKLKKITIIMNAQDTALTAMPQIPRILKGPHFRPLFPVTSGPELAIAPVQRRHRRSAQEIR